MNKISVIISACVISAVAGMMFNAMPVFLGAAADAFTLDEERVGYMATAYMSGFFLVSLTAVFWIRRLNWRMVVLSGFASTFVAYGFYLGVKDFTTILVLQFLLGIGFAAVYNVALSIFSDTSDPDRFMALKIFSEVGLGAALMFYVPNYVMPGIAAAEAMNEVVTIMMGLLVLGVCVIPWLPTKSHGVVAETASKGGAGWPVWLGLGALLIHFGAITAIWAFQYDVGVSSGLDARQVGTLMSVAILLSMVAALAVAVISDRFGRVKPMVLSMVLVFMALVAFTKSDSFVFFAAACALLSIGWNYIMPYQMGLVVDIDKTGRFSILIVAALTLGGSIGPGIAGTVVQNSGYSTLYVMVGIAVLVSTVIFVALAKSVHGHRIAAEAAEKDAVAVTG